MSQAVLALLAALVGAGAAIAAQILSPVLTSRREHAAWLRDKRAALCEEFIASLDAEERDLYTYRNYWLPSRHEEESDKRDLYERKVTEEDLSRIVSRLRIYGSEELVEALVAVVDTHSRYWMLSNDPDYNPDYATLLDMSTDARHATENALEAVRKELRADPPR